MGEDLKSRLQAFIKRLNISERDFCQSIGVSHSYVQNMGSKINVATRNKISTAYPSLNLDWLLTGSGRMLLDEGLAPVGLPEEKKAPVNAASTNNDLALRLLALVESQQKTLADNAAIMAENAATMAQNAATIKRLSEELAAQRLRIEAMGEDAPGHPAPASCSPSSAPAPSAAASPA